MAVLNSEALMSEPFAFTTHQDHHSVSMALEALPVEWKSSSFKLALSIESQSFGACYRNAVA